MTDEDYPFYAADEYPPHESQYSCHRPHPDEAHYPNGETKDEISGEEPMYWYPESRTYE